MTSAIRYLSLFIAMLTPAAVLAQSAPSITIADYPRHGTAPSPVQLDQLRRVAIGVVGTLLTGADVNVSIIADIQARMADPNHVYSCYAGYSRATHDR